MEKLHYIKPQSELVVLSNQSALLAGSLPGTTTNPVDPTLPSLISKRRYMGSIEVDPASWDYTLWSERAEMIDDEY